LGLHLNLPKEWNLILTGSHMLESEKDTISGQVDPNRLQAAVSASTLHATGRG